MSDTDGLITIWWGGFASAESSSFPNFVDNNLFISERMRVSSRRRRSRCQQMICKGFTFYNFEINQLNRFATSCMFSLQARLAPLWVSRVQPARAHRRNHLRLRHPPLHCEHPRLFLSCLGITILIIVIIILSSSDILPEFKHYFLSLTFNLNLLQVIFCLETLPEFKHYKIFNTTANGTKVEEDEV